MATELTTTAQTKADARIQLPQLVLQIEGVETIYGIGEIKKFIKIGDPDLEVGDEWQIGGLNGYEDQLDVINLDGSSNTITQQLLQDRGGTSSIPSIQISLIDKNQLITQLITPGEVVEDLLGRKANVYLGYQETAWPQDFVRIFSGMIDSIEASSTIVLNVAHPEQKKRTELFQQISTELTADLNFRSAKIQKITYQTRRDVVGTVTVTYTSGATVGSEIVNVAGTNIVVQIDAGVTEARHIRNAIENSLEALSLVSIKIEEGFSGQTQTVQALTSLGSDTTINVISTEGLLLPDAANGFRTYVRIEDEVIEYTGLTATTITGCTRGAFSTVDARSEGTFHEIETTVDSFYRLQGDAIDLALKMLMSNGLEYFASDVQIKSIVDVEGVGAVPNAVWFDNLNIQDAYGVVIGDKVTITGDTIPANNVTDAEVQDVIATPLGSYLILTGVTLSSNISSEGVIAFKSKYNIWTEGLGLGGDEVDVPEFERIKATFASSIFTYDYYLKDSIEAKEFIDTKLLYPTGAFSLPRRGKVSIGYTSPPLGIGGLKVLDSNNTTKPGNNKIKRSLNKYFYNNILFKYNEAVVDEKFLSGDLDVNQDSKNRIKVGNKTLVIEVGGLRPSVDTTTIIEILKRRFQDKYKFAAELVQMSAFYGKTFDTDIGDVVVFGDPTLQMADTKNGSRNFAPRLFEVVNKSLSIKSGEVKLELLDSAYSLANGRYGIVSPSSQTVAAGSTTTQIKIKNSFETVSPRRERTKWNNYIGQKIVVHDEDWDNVAETTLVDFAPSDDYLMLVDPALPFVVGDNYVVDVVQYPDNSNPEDALLLKRVFVYTNPTVEVLSGSSNTVFTVPGLDASKFLEGAIILVRGGGDEKWDVVSPEVNIIDVTGSQITVDADLGFTPLAGYEVDLIGFKDGGAPYRYL